MYALLTLIYLSVMMCYTLKRKINIENPDQAQSMLLVWISNKTDLAFSFEWIKADIDLSIQCLVYILKASVIMNSRFFIE